jgi:hypothetical protein
MQHQNVIDPHYNRQRPGDGLVPSTGKQYDLRGQREPCGRRWIATLDHVGEVVEKILTALILLIMALCAVAGPTQAQSLRVTGTAGCLSEWEFNADVRETVSAGIKEFAGPMTWKHVGLCSQNGPEEKSGAIAFQISRSGHCHKSTQRCCSKALSANTAGNCRRVPAGSWIARTPRAFLSRFRSNDRSNWSRCSERLTRTAQARCRRATALVEPCRPADAPLERSIEHNVFRYCASV